MAEMESTILDDDRFISLEGIVICKSPPGGRVVGGHGLDGDPRRVGLLPVGQNLDRGSPTWPLAKIAAQPSINTVKKIET
jgi:hypothetical protein